MNDTDDDHSICNKLRDNIARLANVHHWDSRRSFDESGASKSTQTWSLGPLPTELVILILLQAEPVDVVRCRSLCRNFLEIIDTSPEVQCHIELGVAGVSLNRHYYHSSSTQHLRALEDLQSHRKEPHLTIRPEPLPSERPLGVRYGNLFLQPLRSAQSRDLRKADTLRCYSLVFDPSPGDDNPRGRVNKLWDQSFDWGFDCWIAEPSSEVLVLFEEFSHSVRVYSLSESGASLSRTIQVPRIPRELKYSKKLDAELELNGEVVGLAQYEYTAPGGSFRSPIPQNGHLQVTLLNWKTGRIIARLLSPCNQSRRLVSLRTFSLLSPSCFLLGVADDVCMALEVHAVPSNATATSGGNDIAEPVHAATFAFPLWKSGCWVDRQSKVMRTMRITPKQDGPEVLPFTSSQDTSMLYIEALVFRSSSRAGVHILPHNFSPQNVSSLCLAVRSSPFTQAAETCKSGKTSVSFYPWLAWGPKSTRCFDTTTSRPTAYHSSRFFLEDKSPFSSGDYMLDFNFLDVGRDLSRASRQYFNLKHQPTIIKKGDVFTADIVTSLPYRQTRLLWPDETFRRRFIVGGDPWIMVGKTVPSAGQDYENYVLWL